MRKLMYAVLAVFMSPLLWAETMKVGIENIDYAPYYTTGSGGTKGAIVDVLNKFASTSGHKVEVQSFPVVRLLPALVSKEVGYKFPDNKNWGGDAKKGRKIYYSDPVFQYTDGTIVKAENKGKAIKRLGIVRGFTAWDYLGDIKSGKVKVVEGTSLEGLIKMLNAKRIDGLYFNVDVANNVIRKALGASDSMVFDESQPHTTSHYHLSSHGNKKIIDEFNQFLKAEEAWVKTLKKENGLF